MKIKGYNYYYRECKTDTRINFKGNRYVTTKVFNSIIQ